MAAPNRPNPGDARIPCPLCGGLIHPIAGRCKHCKQDLSALRSTRPAAGAALPALVSAPVPVEVAPPVATPTPVPAPPPPSPYANGASNGHYAPPGMAALANGHDVAHPILPPRPTGRMITAPQSAGWWKSWPMIVIVLAGVAIVIAVVLMVWPPGASDKGTQTVVPPAPERMDTNPLPQTHGSITPPQKAPTQIPDDPTPPPSSGGAAGTQTQLAVLDHVCDRLMACGNDAAETFCDTAKTLAQTLGVPAGPPACEAGKRCLARIDRFSCSASAVDVQRLMTDPDCAEALTKC